MLISLNWLKDYVDIPEDLDPHELAERFTITCAEVEGVEHIRKGDRTAAETVSAVEDWVIEVDNKSITHRPDLWGHYGIAREVAAMLQLPLKPLDLADGEALDDPKLSEIPIEIDDPQACPRYSGLLMSGVGSQAGPDWMQARLAVVGIRPIDALVDLTNYVMAELGQPMHAFDGDQVERIEVAVCEGNESFVTLDGSTRKPPQGTVMIQSQRRNVALGGIMGGLESEVKATTTRLLLESANFDAATIRRSATAMGHRTEASARFEKSLDPALTVLAIARFMHLAEALFPDLKLESRLSDCFPEPPEALSITVDPAFVSALIGKHIKFAEMKDILQAIEFKVEDRDDHIEVLVPSFRATKDIEVEADIIEEIARFVGYGNIDAVLPPATVRHFDRNSLHWIERRTTDLLCTGESCYEIHDHIWYHDDWLKTLGYDPGDSLRLRNPAASGMERMRRSVVPGLLHAAELNRRHLPTLRLMSIGSVFHPPGGADADVRAQQARHLGLLAMTKSKKAEDAVFGELKGIVDGWARRLFDCGVNYAVASQELLPWEDAHRAAHVMIEGRDVGRVASVPLDLRRRIDEHFAPWAVAVAEIDLSVLADQAAVVRKLRPIPSFPEVELDYSVLVQSTHAFGRVQQQLEGFEHRLLRCLTFEGSYAGKNLPAGTRSLLLRARIASADRTLQEEDIKGFSATFESFLTKNDMQIRS